MRNQHLRNRSSGARGPGALGEVELELLVGSGEAAKAYGLELTLLEASEAPEVGEAMAGAETERVVVFEGVGGTGVRGVERAGARAKVRVEGRGEVIRVGWVS